MPDVVLIHSPLVGPSSMQPTARALEDRGMNAFVPSPPRDAGVPRWRHWSAALLGALPPVHRPVIVGHSMAGLLAARLASELEAAAVICLDANMPPESGPTPPVNLAFLGFVQTLPVADGVLPPWHQWWPVDVFQGEPIDPELRAQVLAETPRLRLDWFDDAFDMPDWPDAKRGFIRTSRVFVDEADKAEARGWPVVRLKGTHMHPTVRPDETADAILTCIELMGL